MLRLTIAIEEDEVGVAINGSSASNIISMLPITFFQKSFFDETEYRNLADPVDGLGRVHVAVAAIDSVTVIDQGVVHVDDSLFKIDVTPAETNGFTNAKACSDQDGKHRIPVTVLCRLLQIAQEQFLFFLG